MEILKALLPEPEFLELARKAAKCDQTVDEYVNALVEKDLNQPDDRREPKNAQVRALYAVKPTPDTGE